VYNFFPPYSFALVIEDIYRLLGGDSDMVETILQSPTKAF